MEWPKQQSTMKMTATARSSNGISCGRIHHCSFYHYSGWLSLLSCSCCAWLHAFSLWYPPFSIAVAVVVAAATRHAVLLSLILGGQLLTAAYDDSATAAQCHFCCFHSALILLVTDNHAARMFAVAPPYVTTVCHHHMPHHRISIIGFCLSLFHCRCCSNVIHSLFYLCHKRPEAMQKQWWVMRANAKDLSTSKIFCSTFCCV